jgi:hypothetical protein
MSFPKVKGFTMNKIVICCVQIICLNIYCNGALARDLSAPSPSVEVWSNEKSSTLTTDDSKVMQEDLELNLDLSLCTKEVLMTFFPLPVVKAVLMKYGVSESEAKKIAKDLSQKDKEVVKLVELKASKFDPNPLNDLNQGDAAVKIFSETLYEIFAKVLKANHVPADDNQIQAILDDMKELKGKLFVECIKKEQSLN